MEYYSYANFAHNKYYKWYDNIITRAASENRSYNSNIHELHHALPKCLGGTDVVCLTFKEHYICHWLLTKFTSGIDRQKMIVSMSFFYYIKINVKAKRPLYAAKSNAYANFKKTFIEMQKEKLSDPTLNPFYKDDIFTFRKINTNEKFLYTRFEAALKTDMEANEISRLIIRSSKEKLHTSSKGWDIYVEELGIFSSDIPKILNPTMSTNSHHCIYCHKYMNAANYSRWHGDKCKLKV